MARPEKTSGSLDKANYELLAEFRYTLRKFLGFSEAAAISRGVTAQQYQALLAIEGFPGRDWVTIGELAEQLRVAHHSAVGLVNRMETLKLVRRSKSPDDARCVHVTLAPKGRTTLGKLYLAHRAELKTIGPKLVGLLQKASSDAGPPMDAMTATFASPACSMPEIDD
ncbi:MarR family winged helix-turn-helix transcriptional regulator [Rariglobus hedericola]|uniref:Winged helix-turn-helix transcriptional regulator n=1 Tax=Rariglobus hedericola TaxID=2597822 RepID=A0A556QS92_9BACT|nr:helix-turn-helix domain-containing protein [Rariglobus hedericola]TSJ79514.1 winged helix-turn-helix transcriptional regulator [Rariglobus hedericola]